MSSFFETVRNAMHLDWDPIGIASLTDEMEEYDSYVPKLCDLLIHNTSEEEIFNYLWTVETESLGLQGDKQATEIFAGKLCRLKLPDTSSEAG